MALVSSTQQFPPTILMTFMIFIIEGLATSVVAMVSYFFIVDWPEDAKFLTEDERALIKHRLANDGNSGSCRMDTLNKDATRRIFRDWKIWCG